MAFLLENDGKRDMAAKHNKFIALGSRLKGVPEVLSLGVLANFFDYSPGERELILNAQVILFPTLNYAQFFTTMGKRIFPSLETYLYSDEKTKQTTLFYMLGIPHPRTRIYHRLHHQEIQKDFPFPFVGKLPRRSAQGRGVFRINNPEDLNRYLELTNIAYIQEYLSHDRDLRVILINYKPVLSYWRVSAPQDFRTNLFQGGKICFDDVPQTGIEMARKTARECRFDDVGMDLIHYSGKWYVIEANMKYGRKALKKKGMNLKEIIRQALISGELLDKHYG